MCTSHNFLPPMAHYYMLVEITQLAEIVIASFDHAYKRPFSGVDSHVVKQIMPFCEFFMAFVNVTCEHL